MLYENKYFKIEHGLGCAIPGYLVVFSKENVLTIDQLSTKAQQELGSVLALGQKVIKNVIDIERIYILSFAEQLPLLHFHLFPRTKIMLNDYCEKNNVQSDAINGAHLFDWARKEYLSPSKYYQEVKNNIDALLFSFENEK